MANKEYLAYGSYADAARGRDRFIYRLLEMLPGFLAAATLGGVIVGSFFFPVGIAIFIIVFDVYWLVKTFFLSIHLRFAFSRMRRYEKINWLARVREVEPSAYTVPSLLHWNKLHHLVILPFYKEDVSVVRATLEAIKRSNYPNDRFIVVLAAEERAGDYAREICEKMEHEYRNVFFRFMTTMHPGDIEGELKGKGANSAWAGERAQKLIDELDIPYEHVIASVLDVDTVVHHEYFGRLACAYLTEEDPLHASYQPVPFYTNNIWDADPFARVVAFSATFWHMLQQERPERSKTFSSHSMPFTAWVAVNFGQRNIVSEDSRIFCTSFLYYDGNYRVVPLYLPVFMDANVAPSLRQTMVNIYKQQRRWGWGVENIPYFLFGFLKNKKIAFSQKAYFSFVLLEGFWSWSTNALLIFLLGWLPILVGGPEFQRTILSINLPFITRTIMTLAMLGLVMQAILTFITMPPRPKHFRRYRYVWLALQWLLFPITVIVFGALPGLEAQLRLMLNKRLGFWVTPKTRSTK